MAAAKKSKNQLRREKKKLEKQNAAAKASEPSVEEKRKEEEDKRAVDDDKSRTAQPVKEEEEEIDFDSMQPDDPLFEMFRDVMERFQQADKEDPSLKDADKPEIFYEDDGDLSDEEAPDQQTKMSKKKRKQANKLSVAELKALVRKPENVEWFDTDSQDPRLLVHIKSHRNVVPVPAHWSLKREYLSSKRGIEKAAFSLPKFIKDTGIAEMRDAALEKQAEQSLKQKQRERVQGKTGRLDIDYQKLFEAFFRFQTKPELTRYGEVYYEGKEYETNLKHLRPGDLSDELKEALSIPPGAPPPWLINQQRFGPPPSYPALKIPGLNAPPPVGSSWGFHPGGYGKPPLDDFNRPLYGGDIFGVLQAQPNQQLGEPVERALWGELQEPEESDEEEEEDSDEEEEGEDGDGEDESGAVQDASGLETPSGKASVLPAGGEYGGAGAAEGDFDLRKRRAGAGGTETDEEPSRRSLYTELPEQQARVHGFFGGDRTYDLKGGSANASNAAGLPVLEHQTEDANGRKRKKPGDVDVAVDVDALVAQDGVGGRDEVRRLYEAQREQERSESRWAFQEDLSDMIAQESRKRQRTDEERRREKGKKK